MKSGAFQLLLVFLILETGVLLHGPLQCMQRMSCWRLLFTISHQCFSNTYSKFRFSAVKTQTTCEMYSFRCTDALSLRHCLVHRQKESKREKRMETMRLRPTCCLQLSSNHFKNIHTPLPSHTHTQRFKQCHPFYDSPLSIWSPSPEPCRGLCVSLQKLHSRPPITMRMDENLPSLNTHTHTHTQEEGWPLW